MKIGRDQTLSGGSSLKKFYEKGSTGVSFNLRSAMTGLAIGMATFALAGASIKHPISTDLLDSEGEVRGEIKTDDYSASIEFDGQKIEVGSVLFMMISHKAPTNDSPDHYFDMEEEPIQLLLHDTPTSSRHSNEGVSICLHTGRCFNSIYIGEKPVSDTSKIEQGIRYDRSFNPHGEDHERKTSIETLGIPTPMFSF